MSQLLSYYKLCPITNEILGVSGDANKNSVICTLGKKIVYILQLNHQKQLKSWSVSSDSFSCKVIYDFDRKQYVGVFSKLYLRFWDADTEDINKTKRIKINKPIHEIFNISLFNKKIALVVYEDGTTESLEFALETRAGSKLHSNEREETKSSIENCQFTDGIFSYTKRNGHEKIFCFTTVDLTTLKSNEDVKMFKLERTGQNVKLSACSVITGKSHPTLITIWSDNRLFKSTLNPSENIYDARKDNEIASFSGSLHTIIEAINANQPLAISPITEDCVAIYASKKGDDGSFVILYNIKYKIIQSRVPFKVFLANFKLWSIRKNIFLAMGDQLSVIPYRISADHLSSMIGSQRDSEVLGMVEKEMINEDLQYEESLEFDEDQEPVEDMEMEINHDYQRHDNLSKAKPVASADEVKDQLNELYREELLVDLVRIDDQPLDTVQVKLLSNSGDESYPILSENFELICYELEKFGCSEIEIGDKVIPILLNTNRTEDVGLFLKRYNHISEKMLVKIIKYLLSCPSEKSKKIDSTSNENNFNLDQSKLCKEKKFADANVFLSTLQNERRDVLQTALCASFDSQTILKFLRNEITLTEMTQLMDCLYEILTTSSLDDPYDMRGNLVEGNEFDLDTKLFEWFKLLLDSHYQQILLSHDSKLHEKLNSWLQLVDDHIKILSEMTEMRDLLAKLSNKKAIHLSKKCNQWYSIEKLELY